MQLRFITNAVVDGKDVAPGDVLNIEDDAAEGYVARGTAEAADAEPDVVSEQYREGLQPHHVDVAQANSTVVPAVNEPTFIDQEASDAAEASDASVSTPPTSDQLEQDFQETGAQTPPSGPVNQ